MPQIKKPATLLSLWKVVHKKHLPPEDDKKAKGKGEDDKKSKDKKEPPKQDAKEIKAEQQRAKIGKGLKDLRSMAAGGIKGGAKEKKFTAKQKIVVKTLLQYCKGLQKSKLVGYKEPNAYRKKVYQMTAALRILKAAEVDGSDEDEDELNALEEIPTGDVEADLDQVDETEELEDDQDELEDETGEEEGEEQDLEKDSDADKFDKRYRQVVPLYQKALSQVVKNGDHDSAKLFKDLLDKAKREGEQRKHADGLKTLDKLVGAIKDPGRAKKVKALEEKQAKIQAELQRAREAFERSKEEIRLNKLDINSPRGAEFLKKWRDNLALGEAKEREVAEQLRALNGEQEGTEAEKEEAEPKKREATKKSDLQVLNDRLKALAPDLTAARRKDPNHKELTKLTQQILTLQRVPVVNPEKRVVEHAAALKLLDKLEALAKEVLASTTTSKVHADPGGVDLEVDAALEFLTETPADRKRHREDERKLFAKFASIKTEEVRAKSITPEEEKAMRKATDRMLFEARQLREGGMDPDDVEAEAFGHIPRNFVPTEFKKELQDWRIVNEALQDQKLKELFKDGTGETIKAGLELFSTVISVGSVGVEKVFDSEKAAAVTKFVGEQMEALTALGTVETAEEGERAGDKELREQMAEAQTIQGLMALAQSGVNLAADFMPFVGTLSNGADMVKNVKKAYENYKRKVESGELRDDLLFDEMYAKSGGQLHKAMSQAEKREEFLQWKASMDALASGVGVAAGVAKDSVVGAKVGAALTIVKGVISIGSKVIFTGIDMSRKSTAVKTLEKARYGDEEARKEIFADHALFAKMLIAHWTEKGDPRAIKFCVSRGIDESKIEKKQYSTEVISAFLLMRSEEEDPEKKNAFLQALGKQAGRLKDAVASGLIALAKKLKLLEEKKPVKVERGEVPLDELKQMVQLLKDNRRERRAIKSAGKEVPEFLDTNIKSLKDSLKVFQANVQKQMATLKTTEAELRGLLQKVKFNQEDVPEKKPGDKDKGRTAQDIMAEGDRAMVDALEKLLIPEAKKLVVAYQEMFDYMNTVKLD